MKICLSCEGVTDTPAQRCGNCHAPLLPTDDVHYPVRRGEQDSGNPLLGTVLDGKYRLQSVLGRGGLGTVFRAQHVGSLVTVAVKLLHPRFSERPEYRGALLPEARRAAAVVHENCARLLDVGEGDQGVTYLTMELVEGQTLEEVLQRGPLPPSHALDILVQVTAALCAVHDSELVHCDLSPRNVMVAARGGRLAVKVLDFGIARSVGLAGSRARRSELWGFANPVFSAPELLRGESVDARADVYSFGTLGWLMLTGALPVASDGDPERAVQAVREGRLQAWPAGVRVPRALRQLVERCVRFEREQRPASMHDVHHALLKLQRGRSGLLLRAAAFVAGAAAVLLATLAGGERQQFLSLQPGSAFALADEPPAADAAGVDLRPEQLDTCVCLFGGFAPDRLRAEIAAGGVMLTRVELRPVVDHDNGQLVLSRAQPGWRDAVDALLQGSREGPVDLSFVVPGEALLGFARLRLDARAPVVRIVEPVADATLLASSRLVCELEDDVAVASAEAVVAFGNGRTVHLPLPQRTLDLPLGELLAAELAGAVGPQGGGELRIVAVDRAGNRARSAALRFAAADVAVPQVLAVAGPGGQRRLSRLGEQLRLRLQLSSGEVGCRLVVRAPGVAEQVAAPLPMAADDAPVSVGLELPLLPLVGDAADALLQLEVIDSVGNRSEGEFAVGIVDRRPQVRFEPRPDGAPVVWSDEQLVVGPDGGVVAVHAGADYRVAARLATARSRPGSERLETTALAPGSAEVRIAPLVAGRYELTVELREVDNDELSPIERTVPLVVLPATIEVRRPPASARFLPGLLEAGVLARREGADGGEWLGEGPGWRIDPTVRPYLEGELAFGIAEVGVQAIPPAAGHLLPNFAPVPGHNRLALRLWDVLDRPVSLVAADGTGLPVDAGGRQLVADFWWTDEAPQLVGGRVLVEHGQPARLRIRMPLPLHDEPLDMLRLDGPNCEASCSQVDADGPWSVLVFELPFAAWSAAAQLAGAPRERFSEGLERSVAAFVQSPAGRQEVQLQFRTTRSTLAPLTLDELAPAVAPVLGALRLVPVLAPDAAFEEPAAATMPPRSTYRSQPAVAVRNMHDLMLQDRELTWGQARVLAAHAATLVGEARRAACVHHLDPLGLERLRFENLLPPVRDDAGSSARVAAPAECVLVGIDFFQAYSLSRLCGALVADDVELFRLPLGCELELAAFAAAERTAGHGAAACGGGVRAAAFRAATAPVPPWLPERSGELGDRVPTSYGVDLVGLDFGVREWVFDLAHVPGNELLLRMWTDDHANHLRQVRDVAVGRLVAEPGQDVLQSRLGVVRGLAFGEAGGVVGLDGRPLDLGSRDLLPAFVPGVLRSEQLRRDGRDLLSGRREPRLQHVGCRFAADASSLQQLWGAR